MSGIGVKAVIKAKMCSYGYMWDIELEKPEEVSWERVALTMKEAHIAITEQIGNIPHPIAKKERKTSKRGQDKLTDGERWPTK